MKNTRIVLIRHGQSQWNKENRFTGWANIPLTEQGEAEAHIAGKKLIENNFKFDFCYTSMLNRAIKTLSIVLEELDLLWLPVDHCWQLNERHYGNLQGLNKAETAEKFGDEQVFTWRRSYDTRPPAVDKTSYYYPGNDKRYANLTIDELPIGESLKDTYERVIPFWNEEIVPKINSGADILIAAHGNSLRALMKHLSDIADDEITQIEIPTGVPLVYELDSNLKAIKYYYL
ncbi:2,3-diphosphoglycerate-dependent phosphoglycerate mutase [Photobacterium piscicola]|uniref:2,3-bisphosphoglycerate-dependent phosphoglycerate mutase n=1 Tax=Photobacterium piscicola TaxID=1378299 RepID=A0ABU6LC79_9GAMM|nr:2,3-diphosphoglycerate-dependent phosphoglycerate mutase [Photobacterium piscicola]MEC6897165.1 2,3-diphosphoglycerate-dependent phosphoglycerate mutase [Photobacterium piscicola]